MYLGEFTYKLDNKNRLSIPANMREELGSDFVVTKWQDGCLKIFSKDKWKEFLAKFDALPTAKRNTLIRFYCPKAFNNSMDKQGRFCLPQALKDYAQLDGEIVIIGVDTEIELWNKARFEALEREVTPEDISGIFEEFNI